MHEVRQALSTVPTIVIEKENAKEIVDVDEISSGSGESVRSDGKSEHQNHFENSDPYALEDEPAIPTTTSSPRISSVSASRAGLSAEQKRRRNGMMYRLSARKRGFCTFRPAHLF